MGVAGVSLGGSFGAALITVAFVAIWWRGAFNLKPLKRAYIDWRTVRQMITIGAPAVAEQGIVQLAFLAFFAIVAQYGTEAYAAYGIGVSLVGFSIVIGFGFKLAAVPFHQHRTSAVSPKASCWHQCIRHGLPPRDRKRRFAHR